MNDLVETSLRLWGMEGSKYQLAAARENEVFRVETDTNTVALRLHRKGYRTDAELRSELQWMAAIADGGISVPAPIPSMSGDVLHEVAGTQIDVLTWLPGAPIGDTVDNMSATGRARLFYKIGRKMARLHDTSDAWSQPEGFDRCAWDRRGLLGEAPLWDRFWDNPALSEDDRRLLVQLRATANMDLAGVEDQLDYGLIHADLVPANIMVTEDALSIIDFDDGGFGFRLFDIATALLKHIQDDDYPALRAALIKGYTSVRAIDLAALDLFLVLRSATYVGWIISRMGEDGSDARQKRFISTTRCLAQTYLVPKLSQ